MISMMRQFANYMRFHDMTVSPPALHNAIAALEWIDPLETSQFYSALESCLVQKMDDRERFRSIFDMFFIDKTPIEFEHEDSVFRLQVEEFTNGMRKDGDYIAHILADYIEGDVTGVMQNIGDQPGFRVVQDEVASGLGMSKDEVRKEILEQITVLVDRVDDFAAASLHMAREKREALSDFLREHLQEAANLVEQKPIHKDTSRHLMPWEKKRTISSISFDKLTLNEQEKVKDEVEKIAQKLKDALSRQKKKARRGHIDIKNTIRSSMKFGGIPFNVKRKVPNRRKGKIIAICDISMSVAFAAQFMLLLLYRLQNRFSKIRSFVFIRNTFEVSPLFGMYPLETALQKAIKRYNIGMGQLTNYGNAFKSFLDTYPTAITKDTTLLILGDGMNNHNDPQVKCLKEMAAKAVRTIWLNPEEEKYWYSPSSAISDYAPICTQMVECATIDQLSEFAKNLVL
ncbi:MAG: VWA domain-containing protein [Proteobacteria bacterium]|nr:VWA domain-containing protein [Pseudomonadota bacterium]